MSDDERVEHCSDVSRDRKLGDLWERKFCALAARDFGKFALPNQIGRSEAACSVKWIGNRFMYVLAPDVTVWLPVEHHDMRHKAPTNDGYFGLETYRLSGLKGFADYTREPVYYTIHNHGGNREQIESRAEDWVTCSVEKLYQAIADRVAMRGRWFSYVGGKTQAVNGWLWPTGLWMPLADLWGHKR